MKNAFFHRAWDWLDNHYQDYVGGESFSFQFGNKESEVFFCRPGKRSFRVLENGYWEMVGGSRFGKMDSFEEAMQVILESL